ncbi:MAG: hypothetical protein V3W18_09060 [candidate division Zixibacteria bacterium]
MMKPARLILTLIILLMIAYSCDRRGSLEPRVRDLPSFAVEMTLIKNLSTGENLVEAYLERDGYAFSDAVITVGDTEVPSQGGGLYFVENSEFPLPAGNNFIKFDSPDDAYVQSVTIEIPGDFEITNVSPSYNSNADEVFVEWSASEGTSNYILAVATLNHGIDGTLPLILTLPPTTTSYFVPDTTFENYAGDPVPATYYIYLIAFNEGFGPYPGIRFPVPEDLPEKVISDPIGVLRFGTVAALDSVVVPH